MNNDLISRSALIKWIDDSVSQYGHTYSTDMLNMWGLFKDYLINNAPTVENRPTGEWIENELGYYCSRCGMYGWCDDSFCAKCGAKMKKEADRL